jgi:1,4-alpha-glucan branching enzyme
MRIANDRKDFVVCILNFTPVPRNNYRIGVPESGFYSELLNTDSAIYGGTDSGNLGGLNSDDIPCHGKSYSLSLYLPPLAALILKKKR